jgi:hypothetical protein
MRNSALHAISGLIFAATLAVTQACGARTGLHAPEDAGAGGGTTDSSATGGERVCGPNCTVGHQCCIGGCDGPPAVTFNDCCQCLPGEVSSFDCDGECGG